MSLSGHLRNFSSDHGFRANAVGGTDDEKAFALAQLGRPGLELSEWRKMVTWRKRTPSDESLWVAIEDRRSYIHALMYCYLAYSPSRDKTLRVTDMITAELPGPPVVSTAVACATYLARQVGATVVEFDLEGGTSEVLLTEIEKQFQSGGWSSAAKQIICFRRLLH